MIGFSAREMFVGVTLGFLVACSDDSPRTGPAERAAATATESRERVAAVDMARMVAASGDTDNWLSHGRTYAEQRFSPLDALHADNVGELGLAWYFDLETRRGVEATPIVVDGVMYTTGAWSVVYALDAASGRMLWKYDPKADRQQGFYACCDVVNRGPAVWQGKVYVGVIDGRLIALDAATGELVWQVLTVDQTKPYTITGAPRVVKGKVIIGNGGAEFGVRGYVSAYDADTGDLVWRFHTVPGDPADGFESPIMEKAASTWNGKWWTQGGGGTVWDSMAYDPDLDLLYIGTGNGSPWNQRVRSPGGGDNLFLSSIVALRPDNGEYVWHYQTVPGETWDFTSTQHIMLADLDWQGQRRKVLMQAPKNGFFYVIDRATGKLLGADPYVTVTWASHVDLESGRPVETPNARYPIGMQAVRPGPFGGHNWQPMAFSPRTGLVYVPTQDLAFVYKDDREYAPSGAGYNLGIAFHAGALPEDDDEAAPIIDSLKGALTAWDPIAREARWTVELDGPWNGGALATAGDLVFQGTNAGQLHAYHADSGERLWTAEVQTGIHAAPISYAVDGSQFIAVSAGSGTALGLAGGQIAARGLAPNRSRVLAFAIGGAAQLPPQAAEAGMAAPELPPVSAAPEQLANGRKLYRANCSRCHGDHAVSGNVLPDLRRSTALGVASAWKEIVYDGALTSNGMIAFSPWLDTDQVERIRQYVLSRAHARRGE